MSFLSIVFNILRCGGLVKGVRGWAKRETRKKENPLFLTSGGRGTDRVMSMIGRYSCLDTIVQGSG
jgi:hypothetical protein